MSNQDLDDMTKVEPLNLSVSQRRIMDIVRRHTRIPRADIAPITGQTPGAISRLVRELIEMGLLREFDRISGMRGQPAQPLGINERGGVSIGISFPYGRLDVVALDYAGNQLAVCSKPFEGRTYEALQDTLAEQLDEVLQDKMVCQLRLIGVGLAIPGHLAAECSTDFIVPPTLRWLDVVVFANWLANTYKTSVFVENIANAAAVAEVYAKQDASLHNLVAINLGHGIGCGLVLSGRIHRGVGGVAGEVGSLFPVLEPRPSVHDLVTVMRSAGRSVPTVADLSNYSAEGDHLIQAWIERAAQQLYFLVRMLHLISAPQKIVITGMLPDCIAAPLAALLAAQLEQNIESSTLPKTQVLASRLETLASAIGGAWLPIESEGLGGKDRAKWVIN